MKIDITFKNIAPDEPLKEFVYEKIGALEKYTGQESVEARVELGIPSTHHRSGKIYYAEVNLKLGGKLLRATCQHEDMRNSIVDVGNELQREIKKFKDKKRDLSRQPRL